MTLQAQARVDTDAGRPRAARYDNRRCWRCGVDFDGGHCYHSDAPCQDCRQALRGEGVRTKWKGSTLTRATPA